MTIGNCIKTGARVHFIDYGITVPADLFQVGDTIVINFNKGAFEYEGNYRDIPFTHKVLLSPGLSFLHEDKCIAAVHQSLIKEMNNDT